MWQSTVKYYAYFGFYYLHTTAIEKNFGLRA